jgi:hypothetical protein
LIQKTKSHDHEHTHKCHHDHNHDHSTHNKNHLHDNHEFHLNQDNIFVLNNSFRKPSVQSLGKINEMREIKSKSPLPHYRKNDFGINKEIAEEEFTEDECGKSSKNEKNEINKYPSFRKKEDSPNIEKSQKISPEFGMKKISQMHTNFFSNQDSKNNFHKGNSENSHYDDNQENKIRTCNSQKSTILKSRTINLKNFQRDNKRNNLIDRSDFSPITTLRKSQRSSQTSKIKF